MITHYPFDTLGKAEYGWLSARYHFSFASYRNPARTGFGHVLVINDDRISAGTGFDTHPHQDMEIITYVREGAITHTDSLGNVGRTEAGDVQVMSAGTGIRHSEHNAEGVDTRLFQIWIRPNQMGVTPRWEARAFPRHAEDRFTLLVSGYEEDRGNGALFIHQRAAMWGATLAAHTKLVQPLRSAAYVVMSRGTARVDGVEMRERDGAEVSGVSSLSIEALDACEILILEV